MNVLQESSFVLHNKKKKYGALQKKPDHFVWQLDSTPTMAN